MFCPQKKSLEWYELYEWTRFQPAKSFSQSLNSLTGWPRFDR
jgi:hypothetical protein